MAEKTIKTFGDAEKAIDNRIENIKGMISVPIETRAFAITELLSIKNNELRELKANVRERKKWLIDNHFEGSYELQRILEGGKCSDCTLPVLANEEFCVFCNRRLKKAGVG